MSIRLLMDKPTVGLRHLCENCQRSSRRAGPGYELYYCTQLGQPTTRMVTECDLFRAKDPGRNQELVGQWKQQAFHVQQVSGVMEILNPEEFAAWDNWTDNHSEPFDLEAFREKQRQRDQGKTQSN